MIGSVNALPPADGTEPCRFSLRHYRSTLETYLKNGYQITNFRDLEGGAAKQRVLLLRHDIDISPSAAIPMMEVERSLGISSTYFLRTDAPAYGIEDTETASLVTEVAASRAELGLHYDVPRDSSNPLDRLRLQAQALNGILPAPVLGASAHRPASSGAIIYSDTFRDAGLTYEAYEGRFTDGFKYLSDSRRHWREGCFCRWIGRTDRIYALIHPIWWRRGSLRKKKEILAAL